MAISLDRETARMLASGRSSGRDSGLPTRVVKSRHGCPSHEAL